MDDEEDDDIYAPEENIGNDVSGSLDNSTTKDEKIAGDLEEGEEEGEEVEEDASDSDIDIITEQKDIPRTEPLQPQRVTAVKSTPVRASTPDRATKAQDLPATTIESSAKATPPRSGASYPAIKTSKIDVDAKPIYEPNGKPITEIDMDAGNVFRRDPPIMEGEQLTNFPPDFPEDDKPWRRPGTDMTDYFNYGFDEFTWASYCLKQDALRKEVSDAKKQMEDMQSFLSMPSGMPGMPGAAAGGGSAQPPGMPPMGGDMPPEMQQMMAQMMSQGVDPTQMDPTMFMQQMMQGGGQGPASGAQGQNFGGGQAFGQQGQGQQQMGWGSGGGNSGGGRNQAGRGQGRRNW